MDYSLEEILQTTLGGICLVDQHGRILEVNRTYCQKIGYTTLELLSMSIQDLEVSETAAETAARIRKIQETGEDHFESRHRCKDGTIMDVEVNVTYRPENGGQYIVFLRDITSRKQVEAYRNMGQGILKILSGQETQEVAIQRIIGLVKSTTGVEAVGIRLQDGDDFPYFYQEGFPQEFLNKENSLLPRTRDGGVCRDECGNVSLECTCGQVINGRTDPANPYFTPGGSCWTSDAQAVPDCPAFRDLRTNPRDECIHQGFSSVALIPIRAKGRNVGLLQLNDYRQGCFTLEIIKTLEGIAENIGEAMLRKQTEEEMSRLEAQLAQAQRLESIGRLAGGVAHDFNNMLSVILGHAEVALMRMDPHEPVVSSLREIIKAAEHSADLTRQLLAFARKQTVSPKVLELNDVIASMLNMLQRLIGENVHLSWRPGTNLWQVMIDTSQINQIMANLCVNARDAIADTGKIDIETDNCLIADPGRAYPYASPGNYVKIAVSDNGMGMDEDTLVHIFEPFFTTKGVGIGTGLGLSTVYGIVRQNNGFIDVVSKPGSGTTFNIYLPRHKGEALLPEQQSAPVSLQQGHETILLVEDEEAILDVASMILTELGYNLVKAQSPEEALVSAQKHQGRIDLLITDVIMPDMNGRELAKATSLLYPQIKCLYMSGYTSDIIANHGVLDCDVHFIQKPFQVSVFANKVRELLNS